MTVHDILTRDGQTHYDSIHAHIGETFVCQEPAYNQHAYCRHNHWLIYPQGELCREKQRGPSGPTLLRLHGIPIASADREAGQ